MTKEVAGTIILETIDNKRSFLMQKNTDEVCFFKTKIQKEKTGLASILEYLKQNTDIPIKDLQLIELVNMNYEGKGVPFFVFELKGYCSLPESLTWETEKVFTNKLTEVNLKGLPFF